MPISIVCVGKDKNGSIKSLVNDYLLRIRPYYNVETVIVPDTKLTKSNSIEIVKKKESDAIVKLMNNRKSNKPSYIVLLDIQGTPLNSYQFSEMLASKGEDYNLTFIIGGVYGVDEIMKKNIHQSVSLSSLTFTHQLSRVILLEQIYRASTIINNKKYHY